jgi:hypothetical protein
VFLAAALLWVAGVAHWVSGNVDLGLMGNILIGSLPGVWVGTNLLPRIPEDGLRPVLGCVLLGSGLAVFSKAGIPMPAGVILGSPVAVGVLAALLHRTRSHERRSPVTPSLEQAT